jgi:hypothetical protein
MLEKYVKDSLKAQEIECQLKIIQIFFFLDINNKLN